MHSYLTFKASKSKYQKMKTPFWSNGVYFYRFVNSLYIFLHENRCIR